MYKNAFQDKLSDAVKTGLLGTNVFDRKRKGVLCRYSLGVIDLLQKYDCYKMGETLLKTKLCCHAVSAHWGCFSSHVILHLNQDISAIEPVEYHRRIQAFIESRDRWAGLGGLLPRDQKLTSEDMELPPARERALSELRDGIETALERGDQEAVEALHSEMLKEAEQLQEECRRRASDGGECDKRSPF